MDGDLRESGSGISLGAGIGCGSCLGAMASFLVAFVSLWFSWQSNRLSKESNEQSKQAIAATESQHREAMDLQKSLWELEQVVRLPRIQIIRTFDQNPDGTWSVIGQNTGTREAALLELRYQTFSEVRGGGVSDQMNSNDFGKSERVTIVVPPTIRDSPLEFRTPVVVPPGKITVFEFTLPETIDFGEFYFVYDMGVRAHLGYFDVREGSADRE